MQMRMMSLLNSLNDNVVIPFLLKEKFNFALFRRPFAEEADLYACTNVIEGKDAEQSNGFIFAPFNNNNFQLISPEYGRKVACSPNTDEPVLKSGEEYKQTCGINKIYPEYKEYNEAVTRIINNLKRRGGKTVFAVTAFACMKLDIMEAFQRLCRAYPSAFVYCWYSQKSDEIWLGATPELLVTVSGNTLKTMALAGTRKAQNSDIPWDAKNSAEQKMVADFVAEKCLQNGLLISDSKTYTRNAGSIEHICTDINAQIPANFDLYGLIKDLSPTPAVAGLSRADALAEICQEEKFDREYYSGLCGICTNEKVDIYVTLRCLKVNPYTGSCTLYAGGGITASSVPEQEWQEVNAKMSVIANALELT